MRGQSATLLGEWDRAAELYSESCERLRAALESDNTTMEWKSDLVQALLGLAVVQLEREERPQALETAQSALEYAQELEPADEWYAQQLQDAQQLIKAIKPAGQ
jgi:surface antigen